MRIEKIISTKEFGVEREATAFNVTEDEYQAIINFEKNKERFKGKGKDDKNWERLQGSVLMLRTILIEPFLIDMRSLGLDFERYGLKTNYGVGFNIFTEPIEIANIEGEDIKVRPEFSFKPLLENRIMLCWANIWSSNNKTNHYYCLSHLTEILNLLHPKSDGISAPKINYLTVNAVNFLPRVTQEMKAVYGALGEKTFKKLNEIRRLRIEEDNKYGGGNKTLIELLKKEYYTIIKQNLYPHFDAVKN